MYKIYVEAFFQEDDSVKDRDHADDKSLVSNRWPVSL